MNAYNEGYRSAAYGGDVTNNPYAMDTEQHYRWYEGYEAWVAFCSSNDSDDWELKL